MKSILKLILDLDEHLVDSTGHGLVSITLPESAYFKLLVDDLHWRRNVSEVSGMYAVILEGYDGPIKVLRDGK